MNKIEIVEALVKKVIKEGKKFSGTYDRVDPTRYTKAGAYYKLKATEKVYEVMVIDNTRGIDIVIGVVTKESYPGSECLLRAYLDLNVDTNQEMKLTMREIVGRIVLSDLAKEITENANQLTLFEVADEVMTTTLNR